MKRLCLLSCDLLYFPYTLQYFPNMYTPSLLPWQTSGCCWMHSGCVVLGCLSDFIFIITASIYWTRDNAHFKQDYCESIYYTLSKDRLSTLDYLVIIIQLSFCCNIPTTVLKPQTHLVWEESLTLFIFSFVEHSFTNLHKRPVINLRLFLDNNLALLLL